MIRVIDRVVATFIFFFMSWSAFHFTLGAMDADTLYRLFFMSLILLVVSVREFLT